MKPTYGYLRVIPKHQCEPPGFWAQLFKGMSGGDLWRCGECGKVYRLMDGVSDRGWFECGIGAWTNAGGEQ